MKINDEGTSNAAHWYERAMKAESRLAEADAHGKAQQRWAHEWRDKHDALTAENAALRKDADATRRRQLYELAGYLSVELPELHGVLGGRLVNVVDAYRAKIGDGISPEELT